MYWWVCGVICSVDLEMFLSGWAALCFLFVSCCCGSGPGHDLALLDSPRMGIKIRGGGKTIYCTSLALSRCPLSFHPLEAEEEEEDGSHVFAFSLTVCSTSNPQQGFSS